jgi:hypothetical protein
MRVRVRVRHGAGILLGAAAAEQVGTARVEEGEGIVPAAEHLAHLARVRVRSG